MFIKTHKSYRDVIAICDVNLINKKFEEEKFQLDLNESFYKGERVNEMQALQIMQKMSEEDATFNIVGEKSVNTALKAGIISKNSIKKIQNIPFAMVLL